MNQVYQEITAAIGWGIGDLKTMAWPELAEHWAAARKILQERLKHQKRMEAANKAKR
ncbi:MAG: hypothetical protein AAFO61_13980 [Pseudomonadota bacterium]